MNFEEVDVGDFSEGGDAVAEVVVIRARGGAENGAEPEGYLSSEEISKYFDFGSEKRRKHYLWGRIAAKTALKRLILRTFYEFYDSLPSSLTESDIFISNEAGGAPKIDRIGAKEFAENFGVSVSHSGEYAAAVAFPADVSCGIDIEMVNPSKIDALRRPILPGEPFNQRDLEDPEILTVAWCLKEALSKALRCGFTESFEHFRIKDLQRQDADDGRYIARYEHFPQYKGIVKRIWTEDGSSPYPLCCIAHPSKN